MPRWPLLVVVSTALCLSACTPQTAGPGTPQAFTFACARPNEGKRIAVEGYLRLPPSVASSQGVMLLLYPDPSLKGRPIGVMMRFGDKPNEAHKIISAYHDSDLKVHLADGTTVPFGTRVRVSGRMQLPVVPQAYDCDLRDPYVEAAQ